MIVYEKGLDEADSTTFPQLNGESALDVSDLPLSGKTIGILGAFDSGTNLFCVMAFVNFGATCQHFEGYVSTMSENWFWKHTPPMSEEGSTNSVENFVNKFKNLDTQVLFGVEFS